MNNKTRRVKEHQENHCEGNQNPALISTCRDIRESSLVFFIGFLLSGVLIAGCTTEFWSTGNDNELHDGCVGDCGIVVCNNDLCPDGCCYSDGVCRAGTTADLCGAGGAECENCLAEGLTCQNQACMDLGSCTPGETETGDTCGDCGHLERTCSSEGEWKEGWSCTGEGECTPDVQEVEDCGPCSTRSRNCLDICEWSPWSSCESHCTCTVGGCSSSDNSIHAEAGKVFTSTSCDQGPPTEDVHCGSSPDCSDGDCSGTMYYRACNGAGSCRTNNVGAVSSTVYADSCKVFNSSCASVNPYVGFFCDNEAVRIDACTCEIYFRSCTGGGTCHSDNTCAHKHTIHAQPGKQFTETCHQIDGDCP